MKFSQILLGFTLLFLTACGAATPAPPPPTATTVSFLTQPEPTQQSTPAVQAEAVSAVTLSPPTATSSPTPLATPSPEPPVTNTPEPTFTPLPSPTLVPSPTPEPAPEVSVPPDSATKINIRSGPGTDYPVLGQIEPGQSAPVTGRNQDNSWWQISLSDNSLGWVFGELVQASGTTGAVPVAEAPPPPPTATPAPQVEAEAGGSSQGEQSGSELQTPAELEDQLRCGQDFCITYQAMLTIGENGGCIGNHSIFITVLQGPPPGTPMSGVVIGDTFNNVEVASGDKGPGVAEITLWSNTMSVKVKRNIDGTPYTSEESYPFTSQDELIPAEVLAANGYCDGSVEKCRWAQQNNQVCRGHYSYRVTFHKFD